MRLRLPEKVSYILDILQRHGFEAYAVGGCVRDSILAREPDDWDVTTSARPEQVKACFRRTVDTGIRHGTVTVMLGDEGFEVTTFRIDGSYSDGRHPDHVSFTPNLRDDLMRRDFTINAMAYNEKAGLIDLYGGMRDLQKKRIRCVGEPDQRFDEDALRVMRAVRFAAQLGFRIEPETGGAIRRHAARLRAVSAERVRVELVKLLVSPHPELLRELYELGITGVILPEFDRLMETEVLLPGMEGTDDASGAADGSGERTGAPVPVAADGPGERTGAPVPVAADNLGEHAIRAVCAVEAEKTLRLAALLVGAGKPSVRWRDSFGWDHFPDCAEQSAAIADEVLRRLKFDNATRKRVVNLVRWSGLLPDTDAASVRRAMYRVGPDEFECFLALLWADISAGRPKPAVREQKLNWINNLYARSRQILRNGDALDIRGLAISGKDLLGLGIEGKLVGETQSFLLETVLENPEKNRKDSLLALAAGFAAGRGGPQSARANHTESNSGSGTDAAAEAARTAGFAAGRGGPHPTSPKEGGPETVPADNSEEAQL